MSSKCKSRAKCPKLAAPDCDGYCEAHYDEKKEKRRQHGREAYRLKIGHPVPKRSKSRCKSKSNCDKAVAPNCNGYCETHFNENKEKKRQRSRQAYLQRKATVEEKQDTDIKYVAVKRKIAVLQRQILEKQNELAHLENILKRARHV